ncbi:uncharacterized protein BT62DRAFT_1080157 [Guyanagaster necrorhizus]|uniref:MARVEL domain-containing protein n=1 Tax=Guyanagaster necrorhizus TaxID=856835 RepID=A0A9P7VIQ7_9AGAR|nr:uncharacterized protein BT62DRAFT_1080157 [Guyanagaster necrorhizus MCA 3950]KAG7441429.1 hypothetical protein BT62DRAFT_1080157 [Guyanagaster necrorhizus MCA 3950]
MARNYSLAFPRLALYTLLWAIAVVLLGLTSYRIHFTKHEFRRYQSIVVELLVSAILTILWVPFVAVMIFAARSSRREHVGTQICFELLVLAILWVMWLVGAVDTTNRIIPGHNWCSPLFSSKQCNILTTISAFAWIGWSLLTIIFVLSTIALVSGEAEPTTTAPATAKDRMAETSAQGTQQPATTTQPAAQPATQPATQPSTQPATQTPATQAV